MYQFLKKRKQEEKQKSIRREGEAGMMAHTQATKNMRLSEAKKQVGGTTSSSNMAGKMAVAKEVLGAVQGGEGDGNTDSASSALSGAASGAMTGAAVGGVPGALIGGGVGAVKGIMGAKAARKKAQAQAQAKHQQRMVDIEGQKTQRLQNAFSTLSQAFSASLL